MGSENRDASPSGDVTRLLVAARQGGDAELEELVARVYEELRRTAGAMMRRERSAGTLEATALVHEAFLRLFSGESIGWEDRRHFFGSAALAMRRILVEQARRRRAGKRIPKDRLVPIEAATPISDGVPEVDVLALDRALERLAQERPRQARIVELRYFAGLTEAEVADLLRVSRMTVSRDWKIARLRLLREMTGG